MSLFVKSCLRKRAYTEAEARHLVRLSHRQRGTAGHLPAAPWDRAVFGGRFKHVWDGLRRYLGLEVDKGDLSPEGAEALRLHQAQGRADRATREAALKAAIHAARQRGEILPPYLRAS
jgi:hypothetical protein